MSERPVNDFSTSSAPKGAATVDASSGAASLVPDAVGVAEGERRARLELADRLTTLGALSAAVGHEVNNPLTYVIGNMKHVLDCLEKNRGTVGEMRDALHDALSGAERIARIVKDMRSLGGQAAQKVEAIDMENLLELAIRQTDNHVRHRAQLTRHFSAAPVVQGDASRLCQVFVNLLLNAAQAIPEGETRRNQISIGLRVEGGLAVVDVGDTGVGIGETVLSRVFEPFFTTKVVGEGTGLGLAISRNIVHSFGGEMSITSAEGIGTTVTVRLPRSTAKVRLETTLPPPAHQLVPGSVRRPRVLVVDDDAAVLGTTRRLLEPTFEVETLLDARSVLPHLAHGRRFDVILCDMMMPDMSGIDLHREISKRCREVAERMVFMTGGAFTPDAGAFLEAREGRYIEKPFESDELIRALVRVLERFPAEPATLPPARLADSLSRPTELFLRVPKEWEHIDIVRESCGFFARAAYRDVLVGQRIELVVHELVENAIKYACEDEDHVDVDIQGSASEFEIAVSNRSAREHVGALMDILAALKAADPMEAYVSAMRKYGTSNATGGLGLARITREASVQLDADFAGGRMRVVARGTA